MGRRILVCARRLNPWRGRKEEEAVMSWRINRNCRALRVMAAACAVSALAPHARGNNDTWKTAADGNWNSNSSWTDNSVPTSSDQATFNLAGTYAATFGAAAPAAIQDLFV